MRIKGKRPLLFMRRNIRGDKKHIMQLASFCRSTSQCDVAFVHRIESPSE